MSFKLVIFGVYLLFSSSICLSWGLGHSHHRPLGHRNHHRHSRSHRHDWSWGVATDDIKLAQKKRSHRHDWLKGVATDDIKLAQKKRSHRHDWSWGVATDDIKLAQKKTDFWSWGIADDVIPVHAKTDFWSWGIADDVIPVHAKAVELNSRPDDPCEPYNPPTPNFRNGRSISEAKCDEYVWKIGQQADNLRREDECREKRIYEQAMRECEAARQEAEKFFEIHGYASSSCNLGTGGRVTSTGEFPHMGAIGWKATIGEWKFACAGSLISQKFVLTAAHCSKASPQDTSFADPIPKIIRFGDKNIVSTEKSRTNVRYHHVIDAKILRTITHPQYKAPKMYFDIALMELEKEFSVFTNLIRPACLWGHMDTSSLGRQVTVTGWGATAEDSMDISPELQAMEIDIIDTPLCDRLLRRRCNRNWCRVQGQICGGNLTGGVDSCKGDSGGPMQVMKELPANTTGHMHYVLGVTSFGFGCARPNTPGVYTRVASFISWIEHIVWPEEF